MTKWIRSEWVQRLPSNYVPYQNRHGHWVWNPPGNHKQDHNWPGYKAPAWATGVVYKDGAWRWTDEGGDNGTTE
jgi:hypothetical protein